MFNITLLESATDERRPWIEPPGVGCQGITMHIIPTLINLQSFATFTPLRSFIIQCPNLLQKHLTTY